MLSPTSTQLLKNQIQHLCFTGIGILGIYLGIEYRELFTDHIILFYLGLVLWGLITGIYALYTLLSLLGNSLPELTHAISWLLSGIFHLHFKPYKGVATKGAEDVEKKRQLELTKKAEKDAFLAAMSQEAQRAYAYGRQAGYQNGYDDGFDDGRRQGERFPRDWATR